MGRPGSKTNSNKLKINSAEKKTRESNKEKKNHYKQNKFYVGNKSEGHGFASIQKKRFLSKFRRKFKKKSSKENEGEDHIEIKPLATDSNDTLRSNLFNIPETNSTLNLETTNASSISSVSTFSTKSKKRSSTDLHRIEIDYNAIQKERAEKVEEIKAKRSVHDETVRKNIEKRKKITKKLSKRTKRGQPVMANRLEHILNKLKNT